MKSPSAIKAMMERGFDKTTCDEVIGWCANPRNAELGYPTNIQTWIERLAPHCQALWTSPEATDYINARLAKQAASKAQGILSKNELERCDAMVDLLRSHFIMTAEHGGTLYRVIDGRNKIVQPCCDIEKKMAIQVGQAVKDELRAMGLAATPARCAEMAAIFLHNAEISEAPAMWAMPDDEGYCLGRMLVLPDPSVPCPHIMATVNRCNDPTALMACIWKDYSNRYKGRQCLFLSDTEGESGKSSLFREIAKLFEVMESEDGTIVERPSEKMGGHRLSAAINANILKDSTHASASFEGKRYCVAGDNKSQMVLRTQAVMELLGHDPSLLNPKHKPAYTTTLNCRLVILGNVEPYLTTERHALSRIIWLIMYRLPPEDLDGTWHKHYWAEMPGFLAQCQAAYEERCKDDYTIEVNDAVKAAIARRIEECEGKFSIPFFERFTLDPDDEISAAELNKILEAELKWHEHKIADFHLWLERSFGVKAVKRGPRKGLVYVGMRLKSQREKMMEAPAGSPVRTPDLAPGFDDADFEIR